nr:immunoglobulin light chain junction region [Macaca mulatta]MOW29190.1 immunoglobulin light chain junction region [Macaca mulatta]MOW29215.1 immunoglobulin light chain junction region [Macaca mulatta]MOW29625.1 immunoglobulin light chain junction region [Macaca mulatta]MOW30667.1 immunoglobulin light chain junction region [Macaca mulatta]
DYYCQVYDAGANVLF